MSSTNFTFDSSKIEIVGNVARLIIPNTSGTVLANYKMQASAINSVSESINKSGSDNIKYIFKVGGDSGSYYYWNGSAWVSSDQSFSKANTVAEINAHCSTLISSVTTSPDYVQWEAVLSGSGTTTPELVSFSVDWENAPVFKNVPDGECNVWCYLKDLLDVDVPEDMNATLICINDTPFLNNGSVVAKFTRSASFSDDGVGLFAFIKVVQTVSTNDKLRFMITYEPDGKSTHIETLRFKPAAIPEVGSINLVDLTNIDRNQLL